MIRRESCFSGQSVIQFIIIESEQDMLFLFDIDGTLFDNEKRVIQESTVKALQKIKQKHKIGIATGRAEFMLYSIKEIISLIDYFVLINGQIVKVGDRTIFSQPIAVELIEPLVRDFDKLNLAYGFEGELDEAVSRIDDGVIGSFDILALELPPINKEYYLERNVYQLWVFCSPEDMTTLARRHPHFQFIRWFERGYDVLPVAASKSEGVKKLIKHLGIDISEVVAFGDGDNDYELIADAGIGIAMGNASDKVKSAADYITAPVSEDGVFKALKHYKFI